VGIPKYAKPNPRLATLTPIEENLFRAEDCRGLKRLLKGIFVPNLFEAVKTAPAKAK
jgi:hypothetical protein